MKTVEPASTGSFLTDLRRRGIELSAEAGKLRCSAPRGGLTPELRGEIAARKDEILAFMARFAKEDVAPPPITRTAGGGLARLSFAQERLWFLHQMAPGPVYNIQLILPIEGLVDESALERALAEMARRHETLRTTFDVRDGEARQIVHPPAAERLRVVDLTALPEGERAGETQRVRAAEGRITFDLGRGPLTLPLLVRIAERRYELLITQHHIVTDGWSLAIMIEELLALYSAFEANEPSPLAELPVQYSDFARWQRDWLQGETLERELGYWRRQLEGAAVLELPTDRARPPLQTFVGAMQLFELPVRTTEDLKRLSKTLGATLFMVVLAAYEALLARYAGQTDIVVGTSNGNRAQMEIEPLIGFFVNTQALRTDLSGDPTFREIVRRVQAVALDAFAHQDIPFEKLVEELRLPRDLSRTPLFQVMCIIQNTPLEGLERSIREGGLDNALGIHAPDAPLTTAAQRMLTVRGAQRVLIEHGTSKFDQTLYFSDTTAGIKGSLEYNTDLFDHATIARMLNHLENVIGAVLRNPDLRLSELPLLGDSEEEELLHEWNDTRRDWGPGRTAPALFARQARRTPDRVAVSFGDASLTYAQLDERSTRLAHHLRALGIGRGDLVGVLVERGLDMLTGLLGVLKTGAAYVPIDPAYPADRVAFMLSDSGARLVLTQSALAPDLPPGRAKVVRLDELAWDEIGAAGPLADGPTEAERAYVIYTSGSTGKPKGVEISHGALGNFLLSMQDTPGFTAGDTLLAVTTLSFDIAGLELYLPIVSGGRVVLLSRETAWDGAALANALEQTGATVMQATPATWRLLIDAGWAGKRGLKALCGGEAMPRELAADLLERVGELWNVYGPTETTIWSTLDRIGSADREPSIGRPIANTQVYVLDPALRPVPIGVHGELWIGGDGVALGYLNRPELTAERFVPDPFRAEPGARMYRTGDRVRLRDDGRIEYRGRMDFQVKLRGFRIELGEIEAVLNQQPGVEQAVASVYERSSSDRRLVAYVVPSSSPPPDPSALRTALGERLPEYMVPSSITFLERFPLTPNGKVDRRALPAPDADTYRTTESVAPRDDTELAIAEVWKTVLGRDRVGVSDNFFELGGHSLLLARTQRALVDELNADVSIVEMFQYPTIEALAQRISRRSKQAPSFRRAQDRADQKRNAREERMARRRRSEPE